MNILLFYQYFGTPKGGWSTRMYELPKAWIAEGHRVTVITSPYDKSDIKANKFIDKQFVDDIEVIIINIKHSNKHSILYRVFTFFLFSMISIYFALTKKFEVVICSSGPITIGLPGIFVKLFRRRKKFVFEVRDLWPDGAIQLGLIKNKYLIKLAYYFERLCYNKADLIVTCSEGMTESIEKRFNKNNLLTIPNACDNIFFKETDLSFELPIWAQHKKIFVYTGSLGLMDDCMQIIKGIQNIKITEAVYVFIGEGKEKISLQNYVQQAAIKNTYFLGLIAKTSVRCWLQSAHAAFVCFKNIAVLQTSSPNKMFDAFAAGVPIIQTTSGWIKNLLEKEKCGLTVDADNPRQFGNAIQFMATNLVERDNMAKACKRIASTDFDRKLLAEKYLSALKSIAGVE